LVPIRSRSKIIPKEITYLEPFETALIFMIPPSEM
jgi:hypothetical protein